MTKGKTVTTIDEKSPGGRGGRQPEPMLNEESFMREVVRVSAVSSFESDAEAFARTLWPIVARLAESAWEDGRKARKKDGAVNPYALD